MELKEGDGHTVLKNEKRGKNRRARKTKPHMKVVVVATLDHPSRDKEESNDVAQNDMLEIEGKTLGEGGKLEITECI